MTLLTLLFVVLGGIVAFLLVLGTIQYIRRKEDERIADENTDEWNRLVDEQNRLDLDLTDIPTKFVDITEKAIHDPIPDEVKPKKKTTTRRKPKKAK